MAMVIFLKHPSGASRAESRCDLVALQIPGSQMTKIQINLKYQFWSITVVVWFNHNSGNSLEVRKQIYEKNIKSNFKPEIRRIYCDPVFSAYGLPDIKSLFLFFIDGSYA